MPPKRLYDFVLTYSRPDQWLMIAIACLSFPISYYTLELPKLIIDDAIGGDRFPKVIFGFELEQTDYLFLLCGCFLGLFILSNVIKFVLNMLRGRTGERLLRRLRFMLIERFMTLRRGDERHYTTGEVVQMVTAEVQPLGNFAGDYFATPLLQSGTLLVLLGFIFVQDPVLGLAATALLPVQAIIIPRMQRVVVALTRERIISVRKLSDEIGESVDGIEALRITDSRRWRLAQLSERLYENFDLRLKIFNAKFMIKFTNNVINQITPFTFYAIGGYYAIQGEIAIGALVAVIAAHKDLQAPWKELLRYYQDLSDITARYDALIERFSIGAPASPKEFAEAPPRPNGPPELTLTHAGSTMTFRPGAPAPICGADGTARSEMARQIAGLVATSETRAVLDDRPTTDFNFKSRARDIAYAAGSPVFFRAPIRDNLALNLMDPSDVDPSRNDRRAREARASGNSVVPPAAEWVDLERIGLSDLDAFYEELLSLSRSLEIFDPIFVAGLGALAPAPGEASDGAALRDAALAVRRALHGAEEGSDGLGDVIEYWRPQAYNANAPLIENLLFAAPETGPKDIRALTGDRAVRRALKGTALETKLLGLGADIVEATADLLEAIGSDATALRDFDLYPPDLVAEYRNSAAALKRGASLGREGKRRLLHAAFGITPARHRLGLVGDDLREEIVAARAQFGDLDGFQPFVDDAYVAGLSLRENILMGRPRADRRDQWPRIGQRVRAICEELEVADAIGRLGLATVISGRETPFTAAQERGVELARAVLAQPRLLIVDGPGGAADPEDVARLEKIDRLMRDTIVLYTSAQPPPPKPKRKGKAAPNAIIAMAP